MTMFDPSKFLNETQTEVNEKRPPIPTENPEDSNGLYLAVIGEIKADSGIISKGERAGQPWVSMIVPLRIQVPSAVQALGIPAELTLTDRAFLDLTPSGAIDNAKGKNRSQRMYREACDMNKPGEPFAWAHLTGRTVKVRVKHELYEGAVQERVDMVLPS